MDVQKYFLLIIIFQMKILKYKNHGVSIGWKMDQ